MSETFIVVGAGQAGMQLCDTLRKNNFGGDLILLGDEPSLPYQRPPLSKTFLSGELEPGRLLFRQPDYFRKIDVDVRTGASVARLDCAERKVLCDDGAELAYEKLALATGARVRELTCPGHDLENIYYVRTLADSVALADKLGTVGSIAVVGGGFIGLEVASQARALGKAVTIIEAQSRLMERVVSPAISDFYLTLHQNRGAEVKLASQVEVIEQLPSGQLEIGLADQGAVTADIVVVGIGVVPNSEIAEAAGIACRGGVLVDAYALTSDPHVVAAGDCTMHFNGYLGTEIRLESVQNAVDQAKVAAMTMLGEREAYHQVPWFWSDQYDVKLQMAGITAAFDETVIRGDVEAQAFSIFYFRDGKLLGADSVNAPADHMACRRILAGAKPLSPTQAGDAAVNLMQFAKADQ